ncbi:hypothetical protein [Yoonia sp.]|uniref:hypothetical protein n=1 Tax=Yoonia sp. TaxID=2212373 RepID=UPI002DFA6A48|nr:hypothetical protein [Yoonia sp.]
MNAVTEVKAAPKTGLELLRTPFPANQISKLPKPTKAQTDAVRADFKKGIRCKLCGAWHHPDVVHLDYVGHAALTDRLLDADPNWNWEPLAFTDKGTPLRDENGGLWIKLTVCDVTRYGYGNAEGKTGGDAIKELIGDALRNAAMRFGAALDLWHKGDLHADDEPVTDTPPAFNARAAADRIIGKLRKAASLDDLAEAFKAEQETIADIKATDAAAAAEVISEKDARKAALTPRISADLAGDSIPY